MASSSSSSYSSRNCVYDVFPSFSGEDVRQNFLSHFLKELDRKSIIAFKDNGIERGRSLHQELVQAIRASRIAVVVFSKNYASSSWCLNELLEIVTCMQEFRQSVLPIFYGLDPSDVRKQTGVFGKTFEKTCKNTTNEVKSRWRKALTDVTNITGYHSVTWGNEAKMIEEIANTVLVKLLLTTSNDFEEFPGLIDHIAKLILLLQLESYEVRMIGIWGSSGMGKSTIARALFNQISPSFQFSIFIDKAFVSNCTKGNMDNYTMKLHLQEKFLSEILGKQNIKLCHLGALKEWLHYRTLLIFIDDLDDHLVLDALAGQTQWFGSGSRIIVVTNDKKLLRGHGIDCIYEVGLPSEGLALKMFCQSAFRQNSPPEGFEKFAVEVVRHAGSLPLGLNVLGSYLRGMNKEEWMQMLPRIQSGLDGKIEKTLRVSYDGLNKEDKALFRHIACLFNLENIHDIKLLLADSGLDFLIGLPSLVYKSLVHVRLDIVEMHPLLQKMGKEIVRAQSIEPGEREFLIDPEDIREVLEDNIGTPKVLGISLNIDEIDDFDIHEDAFKNMRNLRFLTIFSNKYMREKNVRLSLPDSFDYLPPKLKLLCWDGYPMENLPSEFRPERLVKLKMKDSKLKKLWEGTRELTCLKEINLWGSENLKEVPDLSRATNLERLYLAYCLSWVLVPSSVRKFNELTSPAMLECRNLETLKTGGMNIESPKHLFLRESSHLCLSNLPELMQIPIRMVTTLPASLTVLFLSDIPNIVELPFSIQNLNNLTDLRITRCTNLVTLPNGINLESLERLNLNKCSRLRIFPDISRNISSLYLEETAIEEVPWWIENFSKLKYLIMQRCSKLEYVYLNLSKLKHLEVVNFSHCEALTGADWNGYPSCTEIEAENIIMDLPVVMEDSSYLRGKIDFSFINCVNMDQESVLQRLSFEKLILSGEEMPLYFSHQTTEPSMAFPLLQNPHTPPFFRFTACAVVVFKSKPTYGAIGVNIKVSCRFKSRFGNHFDFPHQQEYFSVYQKGSHLLLLDCVFPRNKEDAPPAEVNYDFADIQFHMSSGNSKFKLKQWGVRLSEDCSQSENRLANRNTFLQFCEGDEDNIVNTRETVYDDDCGYSRRDREKQEANTDYVKI